MLIFSDVHRNKKVLVNVIENNDQVDYMVSLGDTELKSAFLEKHDIIAIRGNAPFDAGFTDEHVMHIEGKRLLFTHGHRFRVQQGIERLYYRVQEVEAHLAFYGHTHVASFDKVEERYLVNPGAIHKPRGTLPPTYLILTINKDAVIFSWHDAENQALIKEIRIDN